MSDQSSSAQAPPIDILRSIIKWVTLENKSPIHGEYRQVQHVKGLLTVCSAWRQAALESMWQELDISISTLRNNVRLSCPEWVNTNTLPSIATNFVREIYVDVPMSGIVLGVAHKLLTDYIGSTKFFPSVSKLSLSILDFKDYNYVEKDLALANILEFATLLKSFASTAKTTNITCDSFPMRRLCSHNNPIQEYDEDILRTLADILYADSIRAKLNMYRGIDINISTIAHIPMLTSLRLDGLDSPEPVARLVHMSASTLQRLDIMIRNATMLLFDTSGEAVVYSNLQHLQMEEHDRNPADANLTPAEIIQFPVLRTLKLEYVYPFYDDVLFRGNSSTLEYLKLYLDYDTIVMFNQRRVFENKHKVLRHLIITALDNDRDTPVNFEVDVNKFLNSFLSATKRLSVENSKTAMYCMAAAQHGNGFHNIKVFEVGMFGVSVFELLALLKSFPDLGELRCSICGLGPELEDIPAEELPNYITSTYRDIGKNLKVWKATPSTSKSTDCIMLLALVCSNLRQIQLDRISIKDARKKISTALNDQLYSNYIPDLNRVLNVIRE